MISTLTFSYCLKNNASYIARGYARRLREASRGLEIGMFLIYLFPQRMSECLYACDKEGNKKEECVEETAREILKEQERRRLIG